MSEPQPEGGTIQHGARKTFGFLAQKVGPLPLGVWLVAAVVIWYVVSRKQQGTAGGQQTDPAGNVGVIDPATGYVYGSAEDRAARTQAMTDTVGGDSSAGGQPAGKYPDNNSWARAAINYLVGLGVDPTQANQAIENYITSQNLTTQQHGIVNLAIQGIGPPPDIPGPSQVDPGQVIPPPSPQPAPKPQSGQVTRYPAPTGLAVVRTTTSSVSLKWNDTPGTVGSDKVYPASYTVRIWGHDGHVASMTTVSAPNNKGSLCETTVTGLKGKYSYKAQVWANGGKQAPPGSNVTFTTK
jgi:hypothetical protein